jgi:hypothetical protein
VEVDTNAAGLDDPEIASERMKFEHPREFSNSL